MGLNIWSRHGEFPVTCSPGATVLDVQQLLAKQLGQVSSELQLYRSDPAHNDQLSSPEYRDPPLDSAERVGLRTNDLWLVIPPQMVELTVIDIVDRSMSVVVKIEAMVRCKDVRDALITQYGYDTVAQERARKSLKLASQP